MGCTCTLVRFQILFLITEFSLFIRILIHNIRHILGSNIHRNVLTNIDFRLGRTFVLYINQITRSINQLFIRRHDAFTLPSQKQSNTEMSKYIQADYRCSKKAEKVAVQQKELWRYPRPALTRDPHRSRCFQKRFFSPRNARSINYFYCWGNAARTKAQMCSFFVALRLSDPENLDLWCCCFEMIWSRKSGPLMSSWRAETPGGRPLHVTMF